MNRSVAVLSWLLLSLTCLYGAFFLWISLSRASCPFDIEWMEGGMLLHAYRFLQGRSIYPVPSAGFIPFLYPPGSHIANAMMIYIFGEGYTASRLLSILCTLLTAGIICVAVKRASGSWKAGIISTGLFLAAYRATGFWYDLVRADSLFVLLLSGAALCLSYPDRSNNTEKGPNALTAADILCSIAGGVLLGATTMVKQQGWIFLAVFCAYFLFRHRRCFWMIVIPSAGVAAGSTLLFLVRYGSNYWFFVFELFTHHPLRWEYLARFLGEDVIQNLGMLIALFVCALSEKSVSGRLQPYRFWVFPLITAFITGMAGRIHKGGYVNVNIPFVVFLVICTGIILGKTCFERVTPSYRKKAFLLFVLFQFVAFKYNPLHQIPSRAHRENAARLLQVIEGEPGKVFSPTAPMVAFSAGKGSSLHWMALRDMLYSGNEDIVNDIRDSLCAGEYLSALPGDQPLEPVLSNLMKECFPDHSSIEYENSSSSFRPLTGFETTFFQLRR
jgi:4-amino-4-deoxy-L-arabinose transferase-like glycosyltransferase